MLPLYDASGVLPSVHARNVQGVEPKGALPAGCCARGLVLADDAGRELLRGSANVTSVWVAEGVPDFLSCASAWGDAAEDCPAVLGIMAGSWTAAVAASVPDGARVTIATHHDDAGSKYAAASAE